MTRNPYRSQRPILHGQDLVCSLYPRFDHPAWQCLRLLKLVQLDLEMHPPSAGIVGLELHAQSAAPYQAQHGLFLPQAPEPGQLEVMLARMRKLLGEQRVGSDG
jgi:protein ImuB